jgi:hypothetical protein
VVCCYAQALNQPESLLQALRTRNDIALNNKTCCYFSADLSLTRYCSPYVIENKYGNAVSVIKDEVWIGNWIYWTLTVLNTNNYDSLTESHTSKITITTAHIKSSQYLLAVAFYRLPTADVPLLPELSPVSAISFSLLTTATRN